MSFSWLFIFYCFRLLELVWIFPPKLFLAILVPFGAWNEAHSGSMQRVSGAKWGQKGQKRARVGNSRQALRECKYTVIFLSAKIFRKILPGKAEFGEKNGGVGGLNLPIRKKPLSLPSRKGIYGTMAEWLGRGLQNLVQRFESASYLPKAPYRAPFFVGYSIVCCKVCLIFFSPARDRGVWAKRRRKVPEVISCHSCRVIV